MNTMKWLVKREFWEHKGGFFWAPVIAAAVYLVMGVLTAIVGHEVIQQNGPNDFHANLAQMIHDASDPGKAAEVSASVQVLFQVFSALPLIVGTFVVFFYCLSSLYDERKDKSILFWKSLPVSDRDTVISKVASAMFVAPVIATTVAIATTLCIWVIASIFVLIHGQSPMPLWNISGILSACVNLIGLIPITALWALPTIGWLMLCSAWARRVPFLWATLIPIVGGIMLGITGLMGAFRLNGAWYWTNIVGRILGGLVPGMEKVYRYNDGVHMLRPHGPQDMSQLFSVQDTFAGLANPQLWIGAAVGILMIVVAARMRRWRDEG